MPLPTLTWAMGALHNNTTSADAVGTMTTLVTALTAATKWSVVASNVAASPYWVEIKPDSVDVNVAPCRILFAISDTNSIDCGIGSTSPATDWTGNGVAVLDSVLCMGIAPNGSLATFNTGAPEINNDAAGRNPYDGTAACRWSGYAKASAATDDAANDRDIDQIYIIESEEIICVVMKNLAGPFWWGNIAGAMWQPPTDADGESGTGNRLWGMAAGGRQNSGSIQADLGSDIGSWPNGAASGSANTPTNGVFDPSSVDAKTIRRMKALDLLVGAHTTPFMTTQGGTIVNLSMSFRYALASSNYIGTFRQMRKAGEVADRTILQDAVPSDQAYIVSGSTVAADGFAFDNG